MKMKKRLNLILVFMLIISIGVFGVTKNIIDGQSKVHLKLDSIPVSVSELMQRSDSIILGIVEDDVQKIEYEEVVFYLTKVSVKENYYGEKTKSIWLLQTFSYEDPIVTKGEEALLFLSKYSGPVTNKENVYVCSSLGYGQYIVDNSKIIPVLEESSSNAIANEIGEINLLSEKINNYTK